MKKMSTLFIKDKYDPSKVIDGVLNEENLWVYEEGVKATRKFDGTACAIIDGELYKRYDAKKGKKVPVGAIPCCEPDEVTGHHPHWVKCDRNNLSDKYHFEGFDNMDKSCLKDGTYELCGPKVQNDVEGCGIHTLLKHGSLLFDTEKVLENPKEFMRYMNIEGIVFLHKDGRMCKIRKKDFGIDR
jgi:hypothetical protein